MAPLWLGDDRIATDLARRWPSRRNFTGPGKGLPIAASTAVSKFCSLIRAQGAGGPPGYAGQAR